MSGYLDEDAVEQYSIELLKGLGYAYLHGPAIAPGGAQDERASFKDAILVGRLRSALSRLNPGYQHRLSATRYEKSPFTTQPISFSIICASIDF